MIVENKAKLYPDIFIIKVGKDAEGRKMINFPKTWKWQEKMVYGTKNLILILINLILILINYVAFAIH